MKNWMTELGVYISERRRRLRLTQKEVSERLRSQGIERDATTIANWETGRQDVPLELIPTIAKALEASPVRLYELAGILSQLPGSEIVKMLDGKPIEDVERIERLIRTYFENG